ncbi:TIR domain-containing protein [Nocardioides sp. NPDC126508]
MPLIDHTRRKCFISYHHADEAEVQTFIEDFDHDEDILIARGIGASMSGDIINSKSNDYIMSKIREKYLRDTTVTIVLLGRCTSARKYVDWEVAASLRNTAAYKRNGLLAITLPSAAKLVGRKLPPRVKDNVSDKDGYARWWKYPKSSSGLANMIETAYEYRTSRAHLVTNSRALKSYNSACN